MFLGQMDVAQLEIWSRSLGSTLHRLLGVMLGVGVLLASQLRNAPEQISVCREGLAGYDLLRGLHHGIDFPAAHFYRSEGLLRIGEIGTNDDSLLPLLLGAAGVALLRVCDAQLIDRKSTRL